MWLTRLAITRPVTILMLVLALVILGLQSRSRLPVDLYPDIDFPMIFISTVYPGTGPEEIETLVTKPIEDQVSSISGLKKLTSTSSEGVSSIQMEFEIGTDINEVAADVRSKLDALRNALPEDAKAPIVIKADVGAIPVISLSLSSDRRSPIEIRRIAEDVIKDRLSQLPGVAAVAVSGGEVREIRVEVDKARLEAYGLNIAQVVNALKSENLNLPSGTIEEARRNFAVRVMGEFTDPEQILAVRIPNAAGNADLTVHDVARVRDTVAKASSFTRVDGDASVALSVQKQSNANTVKVVDEIRKELEKLTGKPYTEAGIRAAKQAERMAARKERMAARKGGRPAAVKAAPVLPGDLDVTVAMDQSTFIKETLHDVYKSLIEGALLAVLIVFLFLHSLRGTFIVALAIPTSMIAAFMVMDALGFSINMMSMLGLSLAVGILVDDSIVVIENIHRHLAAGLPPREAAIKGRTEIGLAAMTITFVDVVVFVPIAFMGGIVGQFFRQFGIVVATATLFSLLMSFTLTPMLASRWLKSHEREEEEEARQHEHPGLYRRFTNAWERFYGGIDRTYRGILAWALDHRPVVISLGLMTMLASFATAAPKPALAKLVEALPVLLIVLALVYGLMSLARLVRIPFLGPLVVAAAVVLSLALGAIAALKSGGGPAIMLLILICTLGAIAYVLSLPVYRDTGTFSMRKVTAPLAYAAIGLIAIVLLVPTKFAAEFAPKVDRRQFTVSIEEGVGTSLDVTNEAARKVEAALFDQERYPDTKTVFTTVGASGGSRFGGGGGGSDVAELSVELKDIEDLHLPYWQNELIKLRLMKSPLRTTDEVIRQINAEFANEPGVKVSASAASGMGGGGAPISIEVSGPDVARTIQVANKIEAAVKRTEGTYGTELSWRQGRPELQALIDRDRAAQYGISVAQIASALRTSLEGDTSTKFRQAGKEYDIRVFLPEDQRDILSQVPSMVVGTTPGGQPVYLYEVVRLMPAAGPTKVERSNRQRSVTVTGHLAEGYSLGNMQGVLNAEIAKIDQHGVTVTWAGEAEEMQDSFKSMLSALVLSIVLVFMLMAALFESILSPLIIMMAVPQAMAGAMFALTFSHKSLSIVTMIGIIMLVGLVTKNAILMVDYTNTLRKDEGLDRRRALLQAGPTRLRPILMTTTAMIFGMLPTAMALNKGAEMRQPMAIAVIGGLLVSMFLTLLMVPVFYEIIDSAGERFAEAKDRLIRKLHV